MNPKKIVQDMISKDWDGYYQCPKCKGKVHITDGDYCPHCKKRIGSSIRI